MDADLLHWRMVGPFGLEWDVRTVEDRPGHGVMAKFPIGVIMNKGLTVRTAQQHGQKYVPRLLEHASRGELDPSFLATHHLPLEQGPRGYEMFKNKEDGCVRVVFTPQDRQVGP